AGEGVDECPGPAERNAVACSLRHGVYLRVDGPHAMPIVHVVPGVVAVHRTGKAAVVAGREHALVRAHDDAADVLAVARRARRDVVGHAHEVLVPGLASPFRFVHRATLWRAQPSVPVRSAMASSMSTTP